MSLGAWFELLESQETDAHFTVRLPLDINRSYPGNGDRNYNFLFSHIDNLKVILAGKLYIGSHQLIHCSSPSDSSRRELMLWRKCVEQKRYRMISMVKSLSCCQLVVKKIPEHYAASEWSWEFPYTFTFFSRTLSFLPT